MLYIDSNAFLYPTIYRLETIEEAKGIKEISPENL